MHSARVEPTPEQRAQRWIQRHERGLIVAWLAACALVLAALGVWGVALGGAERAIDRFDNAWVAQLDRAAAELDDGRFDRAASRLERVVRSDGVTSVKHRLDKEHERALSMLARAYAASDRKSRALATLDELVEFDPRNFANHFQRAATLRGFGDTAAAREGFEAVLALHPTHWPSVEAWIDMAFDGGLYEPIPAFYERYLDAWLLARLRIEAAGVETWFETQVDGHAHEVAIPLALATGASGAVRIDTFGFSARIEALEFLPPLHVGELRCGPSVELEGGDVDAFDRTSGLTLSGFEAPLGVESVRVRLTLYKHLTDDTWTQVSKAFANRLLHERLAVADDRSRVGGAPEAGTSFED